MTRLLTASVLTLLLTTPFSVAPSWAAPPGPSSDSLQACARAVSTAHTPGPRDAALSRGVNMTTLFDPAPAAQDAADIRTLKSVGIRHVRIPFDPAWVLSWPSGGAPDEKLRRLDGFVCTALRSGLAVILDNHGGELHPTDASTEAVLPRLGAAWDRMAARYAVFPPDLMVFEALNEPAFTDGKRWEPWQREILAHIRAAAPDHTVLLTASPDDTPWALSALTPVPDANVAYVFHFYSPGLFTTQGANWVDPSLESVRGLKYPAEPGNVRTVAARAGEAHRKDLASYGKEYADTRVLQAEIDVAARWAQSHHVRLMVTEFGVFNDAVPPDSRAAWLRDVRTALEQRSIGWTVWEYRGGFGIASDLQAPCGPKASARAALGLCPSERHTP